MTSTPDTLLAVLKAAQTSPSMLEIDGLHAFDFILDGSLQIESMDGRERKVWRFSPAQVDSAVFDSELQSWVINDGNADHRILVLNAFSGSDEDEDEEEDGE